MSGASLGAGSDEANEGIGRLAATKLGFPPSATFSK
jgi:hypothetical protein